jgi:hypothetical protein
VGLAAAWLTREAQKQFKEWQNVVGKRPDLPADDLGKILLWVSDGHFARARAIARDHYERRPDPAFLFCWYVAATIDYHRAKSGEARYDYRKAMKRVQRAVESWKGPKEAEPAILTLLAFAHHNARTTAPLDALHYIKAKLGGRVAFSPAVGRMAVLALGERQGQLSRELVAWLGGGPKTDRPQ